MTTAENWCVIGVGFAAAAWVGVGFAAAARVAFAGRRDSGARSAG